MDRSNGCSPTYGTLAGQDHDGGPSVSSIRHALDLAVNFSLKGAESDGHWYGELRYV